MADGGRSRRSKLGVSITTSTDRISHRTTEHHTSLSLNINRPNFSNGGCPSNGDGVSEASRKSSGPIVGLKISVPSSAPGRYNAERSNMAPGGMTPYQKMANAA